MNDLGRLTFLKCAFLLCLWRRRFGVIKYYYPQTALTPLNDLLTGIFCYFHSSSSTAFKFV